MNNDLRNQAEVLAAGAYSMFVFREMTTEDEPIYVALNPELDGCFAQGETSQEAQDNLAAFRIDYIHHLLTHELPVPEPAWERTERIEEKGLPEYSPTISLEQEFDQEPKHDDLSISGRIAQFAGV